MSLRIYSQNIGRTTSCTIFHAFHLHFVIRVFQVLAQSPYDDPKYQMLIRVFQGWEPLQHPLPGLEVMSLWQRLLQGNEPHDYGIYIEEELASSTPYTEIFA